MSEDMREQTLQELCKMGRDQLKQIEKLTRNHVMNNSLFRFQEQAYPGQHAEMKEQLMLAIRHVEDARMRLGKVLQYAGDGVSIYDKVDKA